MTMYPYKEVTDLRKSGRIDNAYQRGLELMKQHPNDKYLRGSFGWVLYDKLKQIVAKVPSSQGHLPEGATNQIHSLFREYTKLDLTRPDLLFSLMIGQLLKLPELPSFSIKMLQWAGINSFRNEDFQKSSTSEIVYPSLIERLAMKVGKLVASSPNEFDRSCLTLSVQLIDTTLKKAQISDPIWLRYHMGRILCELDQHDIAFKNLLYVVKVKPKDYWSWHALARCERLRSPDTALSMCVKAYQVSNEKKFLVSVLEDISQLSLDSGDLRLAKWAADENISIRKNNGWATPESITQIISSDWYSNTSLLKNPEKALDKHAKSTELLLFEGQWQKANFLEVFENKSGKKLMKLVYKSDASNFSASPNETLRECSWGSNYREEISKEIVFPSKHYPDIALMESGSPIDVALEFNKDRPTVLAIKARENGQPFDCLLEVHGILDHHNLQKGFASVFISSLEYCLLHYSKFAEVRDWEIGSPIILACTSYNNKYRAFRIRIGTFKESPSIRRVTGVLQIHEKGFGFVGDVYIRPDLVADELDGTQVMALALKKPKNKTSSDQLGWSALTLQSASKNQP